MYYQKNYNQIQLGIFEIYKKGFFHVIVIFLYFGKMVKLEILKFRLQSRK